MRGPTKSQKEEDSRANDDGPTQLMDQQNLENTIDHASRSDSQASDEEDFSVSGNERIHYFGDYQLLEEIARGGMGVVYKAQQTKLKRIVAVKMILSSKLASEENIKRFLVEAEAAANLDHPGIVPVYEFGEHEGTHYFSMAYVDGPSLAEMVSDNPLPPEEAAELMEKIAEAVAFAHLHGVVHRDLKPANVLIEQGGQPRITDFGLAKKIDEDDQLTQDGSIMGSVYYMPPEQAVGKTAMVGPPADVYSLGAILYKLLTGHPPFQAPSTMETLKQVVEQEPVPPRRLNPVIPRDLETICLKCLQKDLFRRFDSADELVGELNRFNAGQPIRSRPVSRWEVAWRWCHRNPLPAALATGLALVLLTAIITGTTLFNRAQAEHQRFEEQKRNAAALSNMVLKKTLDETVDWLDLFFWPVEKELMVTRDWSEQGIIDAEQPARLNQLLVPIIKHYPQISSAMIADDRGREHMLLCIKDETDGRIARQWKCRQTRRDVWQNEVKWLEWNDNQSDEPASRTEQLDYDPRNRPWFRDAITRYQSSRTSVEGENQVYWTEPYVFFTTKDLGITASTALSDARADNVIAVIAFDILLEDITRFTVDKHPTTNGKLFVLTDTARLIGLPNDPELRTPEQWKQNFLKPLSELDQACARAAAETFSFSERDSIQIRSLLVDGESWWGAARPFQIGDEQKLWILVMLPESDLLTSLDKS